MSSPLNREARLHRLLNQRRIAFSLIERIQTLLAPGVPFNRELAQLFKEQGKFGSKDRRLYKELIFTYIRYQPWVDALRQDRDHFLDTLIVLAQPTPEIRDLYPTIDDNLPRNFEFDDRHRLIGKSDEDLAELLPAWFAAHSKDPLATKDIQLLFRRPPLWVRIQKGEPDAIIAELKRFSRDPSVDIDLHYAVPLCIQLPPDYPLGKAPSYLNGNLEVQDISSQMLLQLLANEPYGHWFDACAGAGGKSLQLARILQPTGGKVLAFDTRQAALRELNQRMERASLNNIEVANSRPLHQTFDGVLVDAPCSGSGTWRRHPFLFRQTREADVMTHSDRQQKILDQYCGHVASGGILVYCTCSLSRYENETVVQRFLEKHPEFHYELLADRFGLADGGTGITINPTRYNGDGLFVATLRKT
ncbi:MAG: RsmB/NOP family class I SAM-dependent RNA methyltransferase [Verrucomicrobiota bacterium]